jgi:hypothetical protein
MKKSSSISRNFFKRPQIRELVPDLKLLIALLLISAESHVGCWIPGGLNEDSGFDLTALGGGLTDLDRRGLISRDGETGEIFITSFFRDNTFKGPSRVGQAISDFRQVESKKLREKIIDAIKNSPECGLDPTVFIEIQ